MNIKFFHTNLFIFQKKIFFPAPLKMLLPQPVELSVRGVGGNAQGKVSPWCLEFTRPCKYQAPASKILLTLLDFSLGVDCKVLEVAKKKSLNW